MTQTQPNPREGLTLPACLIIMDGFGLEEAGEGNAISLAQTPFLDTVLYQDSNFCKLEASGEAVGLPDGQMGNSEVGHLNIGAGRVVFQELTRINRACADGSLAANPVICQAFDTAKQPDSALHLMGLLSDGGVHSSNQHLYALIRSALKAGVGKVMVHCFLDGRDVPPKSGKSFVAQLEEEIAAICTEVGAAPDAAVIASISGRYYAMDRDNRWDRVERAYLTLTRAANLTELNAQDAMQASYDAEVTDEFVIPVALNARGMKNGDAVIFFNFRPDRAREITRALMDPEFSGFERTQNPELFYVCLTEYDPTIPAPVAFAKEFPQQVLADVIADAGLRQYHIAETEKYAHVTFFLNGGVEAPKQNETRMLVNSPKVATYDLKPEMSEPEVAQALAAAIRADESDIYIVNFANCDMVGHTGVIPAARDAVEAVDAGVAQVVEAMKEKGGVVLITADHGNADKMIAEDGSPFTAHTTALVPFCLLDFAGTGKGLSGEQGALCDIAPTLLELVGIDVPELMTGRSLLA